MSTRVKYFPTIVRALIVLGAIFLVPSSLCAQEVRGKIVGTVLDQNKSAIPGASVKITDVERATSTTLTTNGEGYFEATYLLSSNYQVVVEASGFKKHIQEKVLLQINETRELNIILEVGGTQETVTVTSELSSLNANDASLGQTVDQKRLAELPLVHGDPYTLIGLSPGVTYTGSTKLDRPFEPTHIIGYAFDGTRGNRSDLLIDGAPSTATANANEVIASYVPPSDIVQEFKVQTATFDSQFGNTEGGVTSISIKSGTNDFHGTAYLWLEPGGIAANDFFGNATRTPRPFSYSNRPGFSVNGPVWLPKLYNGKNKTFFLFAYEGIRDSRPRFDAGGSVWTPTAALRSGDFSAFACAPGQTTNCVNIYDPTKRVNTGTPSSPIYTGTQFPGNKIPDDRISPVAKAILGFYAPPKLPGLIGNIFDSQLSEKTKPYDNFTFRVDQNFSDKNRLFVRGSWYDRSSHYNDYLTSPASGVNFLFISRQGVIDDVHTFNPTTVLNVRYGFNRFIRGQEQEDDAKGFDLTTLGFPSSFANLTPEDVRRFPRFDFPTNGTIGTGFGNEFRPVSSHSLSATLNKSLSKHSLKFGGELRIYREDDFFTSNDQTGQFIFDNTYTRQASNGSTNADLTGLQAFASFLLGYPSTVNFVRRADYSEYSKTWGFFLQDDFRVTSRLTLNLGLRYELETPLRERQNKSVSGFDFDFTQPFQTAAQTAYANINNAALKAVLPQINVKGGLLFAGKDTGSNLYETPKNTFLPRVGFAYQVGSKTVIRGGFGIFAGFLGQRRGDVIQPGYTRTTTAVLNQLASGAPIPYLLQNVFTNTTLLEPVGNALGRQTNLGQNISFFTQNPKTSKQARFQIGFQRELPGGFVAEAEFVANKGYNIEIIRNLNALPVKYLNADNSRTTAMNNNNTFLTTNVANPFAGLFPNTNAQIQIQQLLRPYPHFGDVLASNNDGKSWYYAGQFSLQKRFSKGYTVQMSYTKSRWTQATEYLNQGNPFPTKMISDQDSPHRFAASAMYSLPFGKGERFGSNANWLTNAILGGWQLGGTVQLQSGFPVAFGTYNSTTTVVSGDLFYNGGAISIPADQRTTAHWFNTGAFTSVLNTSSTNATPVFHLRTTPFRFKDVRRDYIKNVDLTLKKDIAIRETMKIQLRAEFLNAFNEPYFLAPITNATAANFGQVVAPQDNYARRAQLGLKFIF
ncbi:MAG TPA: TonB-dependent receptor [Pyrinomonadaceae bacterium]|jgi:hypothetical protein|nr:TonB-dependent receptor [Pyrinomonadaceae bacterium]